MLWRCGEWESVDGAYGLVGLVLMGSRAYFQKIGLNAIDAAATVVGW